MVVHNSFWTGHSWLLWVCRQVKVSARAVFVQQTNKAKSNLGLTFHSARPVIQAADPEEVIG